ncbi:hypothetical protein [Alsobacter sp. SYSU BS001988]
MSWTLSSIDATTPSRTAGLRYENWLFVSGVTAMCYAGFGLAPAPEEVLTMWTATPPSGPLPDTDVAAGRAKLNEHRRAWILEKPPSLNPAHEDHALLRLGGCEAEIQASERRLWRLEELDVAGPPRPRTPPHAKR